MGAPDLAMPGADEEREVWRITHMAEASGGVVLGNYHFCMNFAGPAPPWRWDGWAVFWCLLVQAGCGV